MDGIADWNEAGDVVQESFEAPTVECVRFRSSRTHGCHAATEIASERSGDHRSLGREHGSDGNAFGHVHVGHGRDVRDDVEGAAAIRRS